MKIFISQTIDAAGTDYLTSRGYELVYGSSMDEDVMAREIAGCDGMIVRIAKVTEKVMRGSDRLRVIARHGVGTENIDLEAAKRLGIRVTNGPLSNYESVAEHTVGLFLALAHRLAWLDRQVHDGNWGVRTSVLLTDLKGRTAGLVGFGRIGSAVAERLALGMGMNILTWGSHHPERLPEYVRMADSPEELFEQSDFISLHCPSTPQTRGMIGAELLSRMKPSAYFINTARGDIVDEKALYEVLAAGKIAGAAMDVVQGEVIKPDNPLLSLPNVLFTPHCASHTAESYARMALHAAMGADEVLSGKPVSWPVC